MHTIYIFKKQHKKNMPLKPKLAGGITRTLDQGVRGRRITGSLYNNRRFLHRQPYFGRGASTSTDMFGGAVLGSRQLIATPMVTRRNVYSSVDNRKQLLRSVRPMTKLYYRSGAPVGFTGMLGRRANA